MPDVMLEHNFCEAALAYLTYVEWLDNAEPWEVERIHKHKARTLRDILTIGHELAEVTSCQHPS